MSTDIILVGGNRLHIAMPYQLVIQGIGGAVNEQKLFCQFPQLAGDILVNIGAIAAVVPRLQGDEDAKPVKRLESVT